MQQEPQWYKEHPDGKAHLVHHRHTNDSSTVSQSRQSLVSWCDQWLDSAGAQATEWGPRCAICVARIRHFAEKALVEPPATVTETMTITAVRSTEDESLESWLNNRARNKKSWEFRFERSTDHIIDLDHVGRDHPALRDGQ